MLDKAKKNLRILNEMKKIISDKLLLLINMHDNYKLSEGYNKKNAVKQITEEILLSLEVRLS